MTSSLPPRIAIIGMACEFPGAHSPLDLWQNVLAGRRYFRKAPKERLSGNYFDLDPAVPDKSYCDVMAVLEGWEFDAMAFGIAPVTVQVCDIAHWLALHTARAALLDAGLDLRQTNRARIGVVLGNMLTGEFMRSHYLRVRWPYVERALRNTLARHGLSETSTNDLAQAMHQYFNKSLPASTEDWLAGNMANTIAGRICGYFDLGGGGHTVDSACSSSLLSIAHACGALHNEELDVVLAGGVDVSLDPFEIIGFAKARALAHDDISPYDQSANGMLPGEGCGMFVLMREAQALAAGHRIHAIVRGWGISSDGAGGVTAPSVEGQTRALDLAYRRAGYPISSVDLIEGHGTGTALGDKVEITALRQILEAEKSHSMCRIGSIKGNIGHCKAAAGSAGMIKAIMALQRKIYPPTGNCHEPNAAFGIPLKSLRPQLVGQLWPSSKTPRRAGVSAMGFGGANAHITLEEANPDDHAALADLAMLGSGQSTELVILSASDLAQLRQRIAVILPIAERICRAELVDLAATLAEQAPLGKLRLAIVAHSPWKLSAALHRVAEQLDQGGTLADLDDAVNDVFAATALEQPVWVALFPGQGSQFLNMGQHLIRRYPFIRDLHEAIGRAPLDHIYKDMFAADEACRSKWTQELRATEIAQPAITLHSMMMLRVLQHLGLQPDIAIGHSLGEISALAAAGAWDAKTAVQLASARGNAIAALALTDPGAMLALAATPEQTTALIKAAQTDLVISNFNSPQQTVVSGSSNDAIRLLHWCQQQGVACRRLSVSHAFHSELVAPAAAAFVHSQDAPWQHGRVGTRTTVISTSSDDTVTPATDLSTLLSEQIRKPVRFTQAVNLAAVHKPAMWVEIGPGNVLTGLVRQILGPSATPILPTEVAGDDGFYLLNRLLAVAYVRGFPLATEKLFAHRFHRPFDINNFHPLLIVNPCERNAGCETPPATAKPAASLLAQSAARDMLPMTSMRLEQTEETSASGSPVPVDHTALFNYAVQWIAKRTGFPEQMIQLQTKLRDDLNLDSIKVGELMVQLARYNRQSLRIEPLQMSNASLDQLVNAFLASPALPAPFDASTSKAAPSSATAQWVDTFKLVTVSAAIADEPRCDLPATGKLMLISALSEHLAAISESLTIFGLSPQSMDTSYFSDASNALATIDAFVLLLPAVEKPLFSCSYDERMRRVQDDAIRLFKFFHAAMANVPAKGRSPRGLILRPRSNDVDGTSDSDAGAALVKTLALEYPELAVKWITLPEAWSAQQWASTIVRELRCSGRLAVSYTPTGERMNRVATVLPALSRKPSPLPELLGADDVVLVSGGAKGITFELALDLARRTKCGLALLGSSQQSSADGEMRAHFGQLDKEGLRYCYVQADITDRSAVQLAVKLAERTLGPITAILHGAGISILRPFHDKSPAEYLYCIRVKACGLLNLLDAVTTCKLKSLQVISSVLGNTGMHGQSDYCFANAWLDGAVRAFKAAHPQTQCLSLAYSVWSDIGLGSRLGAVDKLQSLGVTPISPEKGIAAFRDLSTSEQEATQFVITGRLTAALEKNLYGVAPATRPRFLETVLTWIPGKEIETQAHLSHANDLYLTDHVFEGSPLLPAVLAIEAMVQVAQACMATSTLPVLRDILFHQPVVVPDASIVTIRLQAMTVNAESSGAHCVHTTITTDADAFQRVYIEATCWFNLTDAVVDAPVCPAMRPLLTKNPEEFSPVPLFQGKFFRCISGVRLWEMGIQSLTDIAIPNTADYYHRHWPQTTSTPFPTARDAALQSGAIILPPGFLPASIGELRFYQYTRQQLLCHATVQKRQSTSYTCDISLFDANGVLLETMKNLVLHAAHSRKNSQALMPRSISLERVDDALSELLHPRPHSFAFAPYPEPMFDKPNFPDITGARATTTAACLVAVRRAATHFAHAYLRKQVPAACINLAHRADGKPVLQCPLIPSTVDVTISHAGGVSIVLIGPASLGIDLELISSRDEQTWRGLLGADGYIFSVRIQYITGESFDCAATRAWTVLEAARKANLPRPVLPALSVSVEGVDHFLRLNNDHPSDYVSLLIDHPKQSGLQAILTITMPKLAQLNAVEDWNFPVEDSIS